MKQQHAVTSSSGFSRLEGILVAIIVAISVGSVIFLRSGDGGDSEGPGSYGGDGPAGTRRDATAWLDDMELDDLDEKDVYDEDGNLLKVTSTQTTAEVLGRPMSPGSERTAPDTSSYRVVTFDEEGGPVLDPAEAEAAAAAAAREESQTPKRPTALEVLKSLIDASTAHRKSLEYVCQTVDGETITEALAMVEQMPWGPEANQILNQLMVRWGQMDPQAAIDYAGSLTSRRARSSAVGKALSGWAEADAQAAYGWFSENVAVDPGTLGMSVRDLFGTMARQDESWAWSCLWELPTSSMKRNALRSLVGRKMDDSKRQQLMDLYASRSSGQDKALLAGTIVSGWATYQPEDAAQWVTSLTNPEARKAAMHTLVRSWGFDQPETAGNWILTLPAREQRAEMSNLIQTWARIDPLEASNWLGQFQPSPQLDPAVQSLVHTVMRDDPREAIMWAESITHRKQRESLIQQVAKVWIKKEPAACRQYIQNANLPGRVKKRFK